MDQDSDLLRTFAKTRSEAAFAELVRRHVGLVYSIATRQVGGDLSLAEDVCQEVFRALAMKADRLVARPSIGGWLYRTTHFEAIDIVRTERRRRAREQEVAMNTDTTAGEHIDWDRARPLLDQAIAELPDADRDGVCLRFFENRAFAEIGSSLGLSENAARMRVDRALEKLQRNLERRGITSTSAAVAVALAGQIGAAPATMVTTISGAAVAAAASGGASAILGFMSTTNIGLGVAAAVAMLAAGTSVLEHNRAKTAEQSLATMAQERDGLRTKLARAQEAQSAAELRVLEAEKDNDALVKAIDSNRTRQTQGSSAGPRAITEEEGRAAKRMKQDAELINFERTKLNAGINEELRRLDPAAKFVRLLAECETWIVKGDFMGAKSWLNKAKEYKPDDQVSTDRVETLRQAIEQQSGNVEVTCVAEGQTEIRLVSPGLNQMRFFSVTSERRTFSIVPGDYTVLARRPGFQDVTTTLRVRNGEPAPTLEVVCTVPVQP